MSLKNHIPENASSSEFVLRQIISADLVVLAARSRASECHYMADIDPTATGLARVALTRKFSTNGAASPVRKLRRKHTHA